MKNKIKNWTNKVESYYDNEADKWVANTNKEPTKYYCSCYFKTLFNKKLSGKRALDIGCGAGTFTFQLSKYKFEKICALDLSEKMLLYLNKEKEKKKIRNIETVKSNIEKMPFKDNYFDFIVLVGVMECLDNQERALKEIYRILKPGGTASIRWLNKEGLWGYIEFIRKTCKIPGSPFSYNRYSRLEEVIFKLKKIGFKVKRIKGMVIMAFFVLPFPISWLFEALLIKTQVAYKIEEIKKNDKKTIRKWYYSFCTQIEK